MSLLVDAVVLARKDIRVELRARQAFGSAAALAGIALILIGLAVGPQPERLRSLAPAVVWIALLYAALAVAERLEQIDRSDEAFTGLWLVLTDRRSLFVGRVISLSVALFLLQLAIWVAATILLDLPVRPEYAGLVLVATFTSLAAASVIALVSAVVADADRRSLLVPVALLPLLVPTFIAGVQASTALLDGRSSDGLLWTGAAAVEAGLFIGVGLLAYESAARPD